jgi:hypothetical protein
MNRNRQWINTRVVLDMTTGAVLSKAGFFYRGPLALAEAETPEQKLAAATAALEAATKDKDTAIAESAKLRKQIAELSGKVLSDEDRKVFDELKQQAATLEEDRKKKAGEFDQLKADLVKKHGEELGKKDESIKTLSGRFKNTVVKAAFGSAIDYFGGQGAKTIFDVDMAEAVLGRYVEVADTDDAVGYRVQVKGVDGKVIIDPKTAQPMEFSKAIGELINVLPNKDRILRGSGKTGSGNSGGHGSGQNDKDLDNPKTSSDFKDPKVREAVRKKHDAAGGIQSGAIFERKP